MAEPWLSADGSADHLGVTEVTLSMSTADTGMTAGRICSVWRLQASEVDGWFLEYGATDAKNSKAGD